MFVVNKRRVPVQAYLPSFNFRYFRPSVVIFGRGKTVLGTDQMQEINQKHYIPNDCITLVLSINLSLSQSCNAAQGRNLHPVHAMGGAKTS